MDPTASKKKSRIGMYEVGRRRPIRKSEAWAAHRDGEPGRHQDHAEGSSQEG